MSLAANICKEQVVAAQRCLRPTPTSARVCSLSRLGSTTAPLRRSSKRASIVCQGVPHVCRALRVEKSALHTTPPVAQCSVPSQMLRASCIGPVSRRTSSACILCVAAGADLLSRMAKFCMTNYCGSSMHLTFASGSGKSVTALACVMLAQWYKGIISP